ncbi:acyl carrier protein [Kitasatospora sp. NPDC058170]|uniref:acyl carrier protein n=1 Tax=Kitasatospora sp. NPDC058170 TaxID=3346364 RepID=UPI0036DA4656
MGNAGSENVLARLEEILAEVWDDHAEGEPIDRGASLLELGVDSLTLMILLDRMEGEFHVAWDPEHPPSAFSSLLSLAGSVTAEQSDGAART